MKILIICKEKNRTDELLLTISSNHEISLNQNEIDFNKFDLIIDLNADEKNYSANYSTYKKLLIVSAVKNNLHNISKLINNDKIVGMNLLPTFINRSKKEISFLNSKYKSVFIELFDNLNWQITEVKDIVGMISPRIIAMIINEASYTLEEKTATKNDIDMGMRLGTNYPIGPFEWADKIGIRHVVEIIEGLYISESDNRYIPSNLLKDMLIKNKVFL